MPGSFNSYNNKSLGNAFTVRNPFENYYAMHDLASSSNRPNVGEGIFGIPEWLFHPIETLKCSFKFVVNEVEQYAMLPMSLAAGGFIIYYLRKSPSM